MQLPGQPAALFENSQFCRLLIQTSILNGNGSLTRKGYQQVQISLNKLVFSFFPANDNQGTLHLVSDDHGSRCSALDVLIYHPRAKVSGNAIILLNII